MALRAGLLLLASALLALVVGCTAPPRGERLAGLFAGSLAGRADLELTYEVVGGGKEAVRSELRSLVVQRLGATQIGVDVNELPPTESERSVRVAVVVDEDYATYVDEILTWTGSLSFYVDDPGYALVPGVPGLARSEAGVYEGERADVVRALDGWHVDEAHRLLAEPIWATATRERPARWRLRVVRADVTGELADGAMIGWSDGPDLRVRGLHGSPAAEELARARAAAAPPIVARGRIALGPARFSGEALLLSFGSGAEAYARAARERRLLASARLPRLRRVDALGLPPNHRLELACLVVPVLLSIGWLAFVRRFDRAHPEPLWLVLATFALGAVSVVPAAFLEASFAALSPWLDPGLVTFGGQPFAFPLAVVVFVLVVGLSEEGSKFLAAQLAAHRPELDEPVDGIVYGIVASLGFAAAENVRYFALGRLAAPLVIARCFMSVPAHMFFGALWGYGLGARLVAPRTRRWAWLLLAATMHGLFDALLSTDGAGGLAVALNVALATAFVVLVRRALRHGVVTPEMRLIRREDRAFFRVGRPLWFAVSAVAVHVLALGIFVLGATHQLTHHRPTVGFVVGSSAMLVLLAVSALGISLTLPLDVAVDAYGITFAGAARPWRKIRSFRREGMHLEVACEDGPLRLGPAPERTLAALADALRERLGGDGTSRTVDTLASRG